MSRKLSSSLQLNNLDAPQVFLTRPSQSPQTTPTATTTTTTATGTLSPNSFLSINNNHNLNLTNRRKFSFPVALHSSLLLGDSTALSARRRLSNVSDVVSRKLSSTIGWKNAAIPPQEIISQGKCLCGQYIRFRLKRAGVFSRKLGFQRLRSMMGASSMHIIRDVFETLNYMGQELERNHPRVYTNITRQASRQNGGKLASEESAPVLLTAVARFLFKSDITWSKVVSLFAITGGLAVDCVRQGHPDYLPKLIESVGDVIEDELVSWVNENGGWNGLNGHVKPISAKEYKLLEYIVIFVGLMFVLFVIIYFCRFVGYHLCSYIFK